MELSKINLLKSILIMLFLLVVPLASAETTFFDQDDAFTMGNFPATDSGTTGGTTGGGHNDADVNETNGTAQNETIETNETVVLPEVPVQTTAKPPRFRTSVRSNADAVTGALISVPAVPLSTSIAMLAVFGIIAIVLIFVKAARLRTLNTNEMTNMLSAIRRNPFLLVILALSVIFIIALAFQ